MSEQYKCCICGRQNVKLWRPYGDPEPLICATCAEKRQTPEKYEERIWEKRGYGYVGKLSGRMLPLPRWEVDEKGQIPSYMGPGPAGLPMTMTDQLIIDLRDISDMHFSGETAMIPAIPKDDGSMWSYSGVPKYDVTRWEQLPTR